MIDIFQFSDLVIKIFDKIYIKNREDLMIAIRENKRKSDDLKAEKEYRELNLDKNQQIVIENYINSLLIQTDRVCLISYLKAIEHTLDFLNEKTPKK